MPQVGSLLLVNLIEPFHKDREFERSHWPLHVTLIPWFQAADIEAIKVMLEKFASQPAAFTAIVGEQELFGPDQDIPVNVFQDQTAIHELHVKLALSLEDLPVKFLESQWMRDTYRAHITRQRDNRFRSPGDKVAINNVTLARLTSPTTCRIIDSYMLGAEHATKA